jgi:hypothetical protein
VYVDVTVTVLFLFVLVNIAENGGGGAGGGGRLRKGKWKKGGSYGTPIGVTVSSIKLEQSALYDACIEDAFPDIARKQLSALHAAERSWRIDPVAAESSGRTKSLELSFIVN